MYLRIYTIYSETMTERLPNGLRYPLVDGTRPRRFDETSFKPHKRPENAQTPTSRVHAVLGSFNLEALLFWRGSCRFQKLALKLIEPHSLHSHQCFFCDRHRQMMGDG